MRRLLIALTVGLTLALPVAAASANPPVGGPPGQGECEHGNSGQTCRPDPQPDHGKDCEEHGPNEGGVNEDHCLTTSTTSTTSTTATTTPSPTSSTTSTTSTTEPPTTTTTSSPTVTEPTTTTTKEVPTSTTAPPTTVATTSTQPPTTTATVTTTEPPVPTTTTTTPPSTTATPTATLTTTTAQPPVPTDDPNPPKDQGTKVERPQGTAFTGVRENVKALGIAVLVLLVLGTIAYGIGAYGRWEDKEFPNRHDPMGGI